MTEKIPVIDFHSHILPRIDHGCSNRTECVKQLKLMHNNGIDIAVATPHFYPHVHSINRFCKNVQSALEGLKELEITQAPRLAIGAEVLLCENLHTLEGLASLCIRGTKTILIELPTEPLSDGHFDTVGAIMADGYTVVLAHIDRYLKHMPEDIYRLLDMGAVAQLNPYALSMRGPKKQVMGIVENTPDIVAIGSDLHGAKSRAIKNFIKLKKRLGANYEEIAERCNDLLGSAHIIKITKD